MADGSLAPATLARRIDRRSLDRYAAAITSMLDSIAVASSPAAESGQALWDEIAVAYRCGVWECLQFNGKYAETWGAFLQAIVADHEPQQLDVAQRRVAARELRRRAVQGTFVAILVGVSNRTVSRAVVGAERNSLGRAPWVELGWVHI
jgi:hypothetical protein